MDHKVQYKLRALALQIGVQGQYPPEKWRRVDSNYRPSDYEPLALASELRRHGYKPMNASDAQRLADVVVPPVAPELPNKLFLSNRLQITDQSIRQLLTQRSAAAYALRRYYHSRFYASRKRI
jgi:hypothetical protein